MDLLQIIERFLASQPVGKARFLLGLSGGEDSMCLFHLLQRTKYPFSAVYVDHCLREESLEEGRALRKMCSSLSVPFHLEEIRYGDSKGNLEELCRKERYKIFQSLVKDYGYEGVILAHHAQDLAETVLKRVLEGSSIVNLKGMEEISFHENMKILRPLLHVPKSDIRDYMLKNGIRFFEDRTNRDEKYLRARMRHSLFPLVSDLFGKSITGPLIRLSRESAVLNDFFDRRTDALFGLGKWNGLGYFHDLSQGEGLHLAEAMHLLGRVLKKLGGTLSKSQKEDAAQALIDGRSNLTFESDAGTLKLDRRNIFLLNEEFLAPETFMQLGELEILSNSLRFSLEGQTRPVQKSYAGWRSLWDEGGLLELPEEGRLEIKRILPSERFPGSSKIADYWAKSKVPACLRPYLPGIYINRELIADLATGFVKKTRGASKRTVHVYVPSNGPIRKF